MKAVWYSPLRVAGIVLLLGWLLTLPLPAYRAYIEYFGGPPNTANGFDTTWGLECLLFGWAAPFGLVQPAAAGHPLPAGESGWLRAEFAGFTLASLGWYANPLWALNLWRLFARTQPLLWAALGSALLGVGALQPFYRAIGDDHGVETASVPVVGAYLWAALMTAPLLVALLTKFATGLRSGQN